MGVMATDPKEEIKAKILEILSSSSAPCDKKKLRKHVQAQLEGTKKKHIKKALKALVKYGRIEKKGKGYQATQNRSEAPLPEASDDASSMSSTPLASQKTEEQPKVLTAAELLRRKSKGEVERPQKKSVSFREKEVDLDDEIRRLEQELAGGSSSDDDGDDSDEDNQDEDNTGGVLSLSEYADDHIEALPQSSLPEPQKKKRLLKGIDDDYRDDVRRSKKKAKHEPSEGLKAAVKEVLAGYQPRSGERLPFYCRVCAKQYSSEEEFLSHKTLEFHKTAVAIEKKQTYCKLCRKQLTSPVQMKEHLGSRPHKERLDRARQRTNVERNKRNDSRGRQWS